MDSPTSCPVALERGRHDKEGRQRALVEAACATFAARGYDAATTREVAERAGCSEGLIHRYFNGKRGLLFAVLQQRAESLFHDLAGLPLAENLEDDILRVLTFSLDRMWAERDTMRVSVSRSAIDPEVGRSVGHLFSDLRVRILRERLERHRDAGRVDPTADLEAVALLLAGISFSTGFMAQVVFQNDRAWLNQKAKAIAQTIAQGLAPA